MEKETIEIVLSIFRLGAMTRELKMKELQLLDATRRKFLTYQQKQKEAELARLDDDIRRKVGVPTYRGIITFALHLWVIVFNK